MVSADSEGFVKTWDLGTYQQGSLSKAQQVALDMGRMSENLLEKMKIRCGPRSETQVFEFIN